MKIFVFPLFEYVCAVCGYTMFSERGTFDCKEPKKERIVYRLNDNCPMNMKKAKIKAIEVEAEDE